MKPSALLFLGDYYGTLAAARCLAEHGVRVELADSAFLSRTKASRAVSKTLPCPSVTKPTELIDWILETGKKNKNRVLYPASDELVFLFAKHKKELSENHLCFFPDLETTFRILNKQRLYQACEKAKVPYPKTWYPKNEEDVRALDQQREALGEVLLKPKTQIQLRSGTKAAETGRGRDLVHDFQLFLAQNPYGKELLDYDPEVKWPMVQEFLPNAAQGIYSLAGFASNGHAKPLARASQKVLQQPRKLGIGLCFESRPVSEELLLQVGALCKELGYEGTFELEFVSHEGQMLLIDFNPRNYSQLALEISQGLPSPYLHYLAAIQDNQTFETTWKRSMQWASSNMHVYTHASLLSLVRAAQALTHLKDGTPSEEWGAWLKRHEGHITDAVRSHRDLAPAFFDALLQAKFFAKHPRYFVRSLLR